MVHWLCCIHLCCCKYSTRGRCCMCPFSWDKTSHHPQFQVLPCKHSFWSTSTLRELQQESRKYCRKYTKYVNFCYLPFWRIFLHIVALTPGKCSNCGDWAQSVIESVLLSNGSPHFGSSSDLHSQHFIERPEKTGKCSILFTNFRWYISTQTAPAPPNIS